MSVYLAIDIGAGSGRVMAGRFDGKKLAIEEVRRFPNEGVRLPSGWHWNVTQLFSDIKQGIAQACRQHGPAVVSLAVDTWGVDYGLLDGNGRLLGVPWMYRDSRTDGTMPAVFDLVPREEIYRRTGIQFMFFNTLFQLFAESRRHPGAMAAATQLLFMPDLLACWLSGERVIERTIASTSQLLKVGSASWDTDLIRLLGLPQGIFSPTIDPGVRIGSLLPELREELGVGNIAVATCGSHDTASAVASLPATSDRPLFLSSGTWSLLGRELDAPAVGEHSLQGGFSNEQGLCGTTRLLKNVAGMWLLQECKRAWDAAGHHSTYADLVAEASLAPGSFLLDPDAPAFSRPCDMPAAIAAYAKKTGQPAPGSRGEYVRGILESLALKYRHTIQCLRQWMPGLPDTLHIGGGGSQNSLLNQMTADATGLRVIAGPVEATAAGNILAQLMASGEISSLKEGRTIIRDSFETQIFEPREPRVWNEKAARLEKILQLT